MDNPTLEDFLRRALVWPDPDSESGWINLHWRMHDRKGITGSQAFKTLQEVLGFRLAKDRKYPARTVVDRMT